MQGLEKSPAELINSTGESEILLVCEHASSYIPDNFADLGLSNAERLSHIAWDIGAADMARELSNLLDACLIQQTYSRLLYDCNRPPHELSAIPQLSEITEIPGNTDLSEEQRNYRIDQIYRPFHQAIDEQIKARKAAGRQTILVTIHSFTPTFKGKRRDVELGIICDEDNPFAEKFYRQAHELCDYEVRINEPYGPSDPVLHMVTRHGSDNQIANVMLEVRNDLIAQATGQKEWAQLIATTFKEMKV